MKFFFQTTHNHLFTHVIFLILEDSMPHDSIPSFFCHCRSIAQRPSSWSINGFIEHSCGNVEVTWSRAGRSWKTTGLKQPTWLCLTGCHGKSPFYSQVNHGKPSSSMGHGFHGYVSHNQRVNTKENDLLSQWFVQSCPYLSSFTAIHCKAKSHADT